MKYSEQISNTVFNKKRQFSVSWDIIPYGTNKQSLPKKGGVYMLTVNNDIVYVGSTNYFPSRMKCHIVLNRLRRELPDVSALSILFTPMERFKNSEFEKHLIHLLKPKYNYGGTGNITEIGLQLKKALNGRTLRWLCFKVRIAEGDLSKKTKGYIEFTKEEIDRINEVLNATIRFTNGTPK